jgi:hypothetical protein
MPVPTSAEFHLRAVGLRPVSIQLFSVYCHFTSPIPRALSLIASRLCGLVVRVPGCTTEMYCVSCEVRTEFIYVM